MVVSASKDGGRKINYVRSSWTPEVASAITWWKDQKSTTGSKVQAESSLWRHRPKSITHPASSRNKVSAG